MKANNLSISIPNYGCNKNCPYCISKMTGYTKSNEPLFGLNMNKLFNITKRCDVISVSFTSKGEILHHQYSTDIFFNFLSNFKDHFSCELQTNGLNLNEDLISKLCIRGLDIIAISIDSFNDIQKFYNIFKDIKDYNMTSRITINLTNSIYNNKIDDYFEICKNLKIDQISFRNISTPTYNLINDERSRKTNEWIYKNIDKNKVEEFLKNYKEYVLKNGYKIRNLPYGATIYNVDGISATYFDYCIQDNNNDENIRSLIYHEDGHLSTTWYGSNVGRIF